MPSLNEAAYSLAGKLGKTDYEFINNLKFTIINYRALFIRQDNTKYGRQNNIFIQDLGCVPIIKTDSAECCTVESECLVYRTENQVPKPVRFINQDFEFIGSIDKITKYTRLIPEEVNYMKYNKYSTGSRYYYLNDFIYVTDEVDYINIRGIFEDPREAERFNHCTGAECYTDDSEFPIAADMLVGIINGIIDGDLRILRDGKTSEIKT